MSIEIITIIIFASLFLLLAAGFQISFATGAVATVFAIMLWGIDHLPIIASAGFSSLRNLNLVAIPLFIFLGFIFQHSGVGDDLFKTVHIWLGNVPGGLAVGCLLISILFAAICGGLAAVIFMLGAVAFPAMLKRGYNKHLSLGCITVGGLLGLIIPPSIEIIIYTSVVGGSVGKMYLGCLIPGLIMAVLYILYILIRCWLNPKLGPPASIETKIDWSVRIASLRSIILPLILVVIIMGGIYGGIMSPLEASSIGALGSLIIAAIYRRLTFKVVKESVNSTLSIAGLIAWLLIAVGCLTSVYEGVGAPDLALKVAHAIPGGGWGTIVVMQIALLVFGMFMDDVAIILIFGPIFAHVIKAMGFDPLWYGVVYLINMQVAFLTPPYGFALFYMRAATPKDYNITMVDVYRAVLPFIGLTVLTLILVMIFPPLATFLPRHIIGGG
jgi:tripartite ATP-independent transporter DctM subunit